MKKPMNQKDFISNLIHLKTVERDNYGIPVRYISSDECGIDSNVEFENLQSARDYWKEALNYSDPVCWSE